MTATIINFYGGPGAGKSTTAAELFSAMKRGGQRVELVTEYAKDLTYQQAFNKMRDQGYVFAKQHHRIWQSAETVDWIITDSPLLLSLVYANAAPYSSAEFRDYALSIYRHYDNIDIFLERNVVEHPYQEYGRTQTLGDAVNLDQRIKTLLGDVGVRPHYVDIGDAAFNNILRIIGCTASV